MNGAKAIIRLMPGTHSRGVSGRFQSTF